MLNIKNIKEAYRIGRTTFINIDKKGLIFSIRTLSFSSEPQSQEPVNQRKEQVRGYKKGSYKLWQVVKVAVTIPVLGKFLPRDLSPLKPILVEGDWDGVVKWLVSVTWDRGYGVDKYRQLGTYPHLKEAGYKYPSPKCES